MTRQTIAWAILIATLAAAIRASGPLEAAEPGATMLWYAKPAGAWTEAMPVGNGRLGAMVFGGTAHERLQLNEDTLWTGGPRDYQHPDACKSLPEIRRLLWEGRQREAEALAMERFMSVPLRQFAYQPLADLWLDLPGHEQATAYRRELSGSSKVF